MTRQRLRRENKSDSLGQKMNPWDGNTTLKVSPLDTNMERRLLWNQRTTERGMDIKEKGCA